MQHGARPWTIGLEAEVGTTRARHLYSATLKPQPQWIPAYTARMPRIKMHIGAATPRQPTHTLKVKQTVPKSAIATPSEHRSERAVHTQQLRAGLRGLEKSTMLAGLQKSTSQVDSTAGHPTVNPYSPAQLRHDPPHPTALLPAVPRYLRIHAGA